jgi:hypothetical protein
LEKNAFSIVKQMQQIKGEDDDDNSRNGDHVSRRNTIHRIGASQKKPQFTGNLDSQFRKRLDSIGATVDLNGMQTF